ASGYSGKHLATGNVQHPMTSTEDSLIEVQFPSGKANIPFQARTTVLFSGIPIDGCGVKKDQFRMKRCTILTIISLPVMTNPLYRSTCYKFKTRMSELIPIDELELNMIIYSRKAVIGKTGYLIHNRQVLLITYYSSTLPIVTFTRSLLFTTKKSRKTHPTSYQKRPSYLVPTRVCKIE
ncbi:hypothetical protein J6590_106729, partial [Homalodisca vitripennis]